MPQTGPGQDFVPGCERSRCRRVRRTPGAKRPSAGCFSVRFRAEVESSPSTGRVAAQPPEAVDGAGDGAFGHPSCGRGDVERDRSRTLKRPAEGPRLRRGQASCGRDGADNDHAPEAVYSVPPRRDQPTYTDRGRTEGREDSSPPAAKRLAATTGIPCASAELPEGN